VDVPKQVAIALQRLGTRDIHVVVDKPFDIANSTSVVVCQRFILALISIELPLHLNWLTKKNSKVKVGFKNLQGILKCCSALNSSHV